MDRKEQILKILKEYTETDEWKWSAPQIGRDYCLDCIEALEKQIPKEIRQEIEGGRFERYCPNNCQITGATMYINIKYCPYCGQAIKWE